MPTEADYRLPRSVIPVRYRLRIEPDLMAGSFVGRVDIDVNIVEPTDRMVLNAIELDPGDVSLAASGGALSGVVSLDDERQRMTVEFGRTLEVGAATLTIEYAGILNDHLHGFYRSTYTNAAGVVKTLATTQFESTDARRAFPCWDEPDLKATFAVTLVVASGLTAVSNAAEIDRREVADGRIEITFADTVVMSTYLVAFIVGELEATEPFDVNGVPLRIVYPPGKGHLTDFAIEAGAFALDYFARYYDVPYPGDKLDMVAIPDFGFGAMENLGCITYRETALLVDRASATQAELARVASVIAHEIAHMWFGDLVTMKWWNGVWLNEAFATFAENKCTAAFRPDWKYWLVFATDRSTSQETDALAATRPVEFPVASPSEADAMFDVLTYEKGSSVLRMLEQFLGEDTFRRGVSLYLQRHSFANTENRDLWTALEEVSGEPVAEIMDTWIFQGGYPVLDVTRTGDAITLSQRPFRFIGEGEGSWKVPVLYRSSQGAGRVVVGEDAVTVAVGDDVVVDAGGEGFYRVSYDDQMFESLVERLPELDDLERYSFVSDVLAEMLAGSVTSSDYLELTDRLCDESENEIWALALQGVDELARVISSDDRGDLQAYVTDVTSKVVEELGWVPGDGESDRRRALRGTMLRTVGILGGDQETIAMARSIERSEDIVDAEIADAALAITAAHGDIDDFHRFIDLSKTAPTPQLTVKYLRSAAQVPHPDVPTTMVAMVIDGAIRSQDSFWVLAVLIGHRDNGVRAWRAVTERWDEVMAVIPPAHRYRVLDLLKYRSEPEVVDGLEEWFAEHPIEGADKAVRQRLEMVNVRAGLRARESGQVGRAVQAARDRSHT